MKKPWLWLAIAGGIFGVIASASALGMTPWMPKAEVMSKVEARQVHTDLSEGIERIERRQEKMLDILMEE